MQCKRWLADRRPYVVIVADSSFAALDLIAAVRRHVCLITRLRLDASLFEPAPDRRPNQKGRPRLKAQSSCPNSARYWSTRKTVWTQVMMAEWSWRADPRTGIRLCHGGLVLQWPATSPDPLGPGSRPIR